MKHSAGTGEGGDMKHSPSRGRWLWRLWLTLILTIQATSALAQLSTAALNGVVTDPTGAVIPKASLVLRNVDTGIETQAISNDTGNYRFSNVSPGRYTLKVSAGSFTSKQVSEFILAVNQTATIDVSLSAGSTSEMVTVDATAEQLQVSSAELGTVIATKQVNNLPLNGRNFTQLLSLTPGVAPISVGQNSMSGRTGGFAAPIAEDSAFVFPAINGATNRSNYFLTDGMNNFAAFLSTYAVPPIVDAIQEFKVVSHTDSSQFGSVLGGVVNVVTKSGTNQFHGSAWEYIRNDAFDSQDQFAPVVHFRQNQFGGAIGGPVALPALKHNTFFYGAYQGFRYSKPIATPILVPTAAMYAGDFSSYCTAGFTAGLCNDPTKQLYNPLTTVPSGSGFSRTAYLNNQIPVGTNPGDIQPQIVTFLQSVLPAAGPLNTELNSNASNPDPNTQHQNEFNVRLDHTFGQKDNVSFRYSFINSDVLKPTSLPGLQTTDSIPGRNWGGNWVHTFSPSLQLQMLFSRTTVSDNAVTKFKTDTTSIVQAAGFAPGFASNFSGTSGSLLPDYQLGNGYVDGGEGIVLTPQATDNNQVSATLSKVKGTHTYAFGANYITSVFSSPLSNVAVSFDNRQTSDGNGNGGFSVASALIGVPDRANRRDVSEKTRLGGLFSAFFQDSWKATSKLTLNYGVRYDLTLIPAYGTIDTIDKQGGIETGDFDFSSGTYVLQYPPPPCAVRGHAPCIPSIMLDAQGNAVACDPATQTCLPPGTLPPHVVVDPRGRISHNSYTNIGPHLGFAYRVADRTVVRGGAGIVYDNWAAVSQMSQNIEGGWPGIGQLIASNLNVPGGSTAPNGPPTATYADPFSAGGVGAGIPAPTPFNANGTLWHYDPHIKNPYAYQFNFGVQRQLNSTTTITGSYVGALTHRADVGGMYNTALQPSSLPNPQSRSLYPYMIATFYDRSVGFADYHSFQLSVDKRFSGGLAYQVAYTFSKALTENDGWFGAEGKNVADPYNPRASLSPAGYDLPHLLTVNANYEVPIGQGKHFSSGNHVVDYIIGNWQVNGILAVRSGQHYSVIDGSGDPANTGNQGWAGYEQANLVGDPNSGSCPGGQAVHTQGCWFNTSAFQAPQFTFGNIRPNAFQAQRYWNIDFSVFRGFPLFAEQRKLEFRAEAFNLFNTVIFGPPNGDVSNTANFGTVTQRANGNSPRVLQFGLRFIF
jgi:Carboxypeptidase regulatory-like domain